jgi:hypothetical protein
MLHHADIDNAIFTFHSEIAIGGVRFRQYLQACKISIEMN